MSNNQSSEYILFNKTRLKACEIIVEKMLGKEL